MEELKLTKLVEDGRVFRLNVKTQAELYKFFADTLGKEGYVKETFLEALTKREAKFPTGIISSPYNIGLPHVDSEHVQANALAVTILDEPILWHRMDNPEEEIPVKVVFLLMIETLELHVKAISNLCGIWVNEQLMTELLDIQTKEDLLALLKKHNV